MLKPLMDVAGVLGFCDIMECVLVDDEQSRGMVEGMRNGAFYSNSKLQNVYIVMQ